MADRNKTVLVTGANGMLAANIIERLLHEGYAVVATLRPGRKYAGETFLYTVRFTLNVTLCSTEGSISIVIL